MTPRRVLHVIESYGGGVASAVDSYIDSTPDIEHHALIRVRPGDFSDDGEFARFASVSHLSKGMRAIREVRVAATRVTADVVHAHSSFAGAYVRVALRPAEDRRIVYTPHCFAFEREDLPASSRLMFRIVERFLAPRTSVLAGCSEREVALFRNFAPTVDSVYVPNVASVPDGRRPIEPRDHPLHLVAVGRLAAQKDPLFFRDVVLALRDQTAEPVAATWIGGGDEALVNALTSCAIDVTGWQARSEVYNRLRTGGVYVHSARWEGFPMAVLEAHSLDLPILARAVGPLTVAPPDWADRDPAKLARRALSLGSLSARRKNICDWAEFLRPNTRHGQEGALRAVYGTVPVEGSRQIA